MDIRPWGSFTIIADEPGLRIKRIAILPGKRLSLQRHSHRAEHLYVLTGEGSALVDGHEHRLQPGTSVDIPLGAVHRFANTGNSDLVIVELETGEIISEEDIERFEDDFGRT